MGPNHVALNLHRDSHIQRGWPLLTTKLLTAMRSQPTMYFSPQIELKVRCIEFHTCA